jgi:hypothetical protein
MGISEKLFWEALPLMVEHAICSPELVSTPRVPYEEDLNRLFQYVFDGREVDF